MVKGLAQAGSEVRIYALGGRGIDYKKRVRSGVTKENDLVILFVGSWYPPNREAVSFIQDFVEKNRTFVRDRDIHFLIVGGVAKESHRADHMTCTGFVDDVLPYFQAADIAMNPVVTGSGTNVKVFEYIAARLPLLSTPFGLRGFDLTDLENFFQFERSSLQEVLERIKARQCSGDLPAMAEKAFAQNKSRIDMKIITQKILERSFPNSEY